VAKSRVLLIDDDDLVAIALYQHLVASGIDVDLATEPLHAEKLMREHRYGLVVMDAHLTGNLRDRAADLIERVSKLCGDARIVLLSAYPSEELASSFTVFAKPQPVVFLGEMIGGFVENGTLPAKAS
jgi:DNA-binding response OmpR family regulator